MALTFAIVIVSHPVSTQGSLSAYQFAKAALALGHHIHQVFFYGDGAAHGNRYSQIPQDETDVNLLWRTLANEHHLSLTICSGSALRRGLLNQEEATRLQQAEQNLSLPFQLMWLGELTDAYTHSDRVLVFGA